MPVMNAAGAARSEQPTVAQEQALGSAMPYARRAVLVTVASEQITVICGPWEPSGYPDASGKFYDAWATGARCIKQLKSVISTDLTEQIARVCTISVLLARLGLTPILRAVLLPDEGGAAIVVDRAVVARHALDARRHMELESSLQNAARGLGVGRHSYDDLPGIDTFALEARGHGNVGLLHGRVVLVDIDPKCYWLPASEQHLADRLAATLNRLRTEG